MFEKRFDTSCKKCVFATYDNITQKDCSLQLLDKYRAHDIEIIEAYDEDKEFYVLHKLKCPYKRLDSWKYSNEPLEIQKEHVQKEANVHFHAIIFLNDDIEDANRTLQSLINQKLPPVQITLVRLLGSKVHPVDLANLCQTIRNISWRVENLTVIVESEDEILKLILPFIKTNVFIVFQAGFIVPDNTLIDISKEVVENLQSFIMITPNSTKNGTVCIKQLYSQYAAYTGNTLQEKLEKDGCPQELLIPITKIVPNFPK